MTIYQTDFMYIVSSRQQLRAAGNRNNHQIREPAMTACRLITKVTVVWQIAETSSPRSEGYKKSMSNALSNSLPMLLD